MTTTDPVVTLQRVLAAIDNTRSKGSHGRRSAAERADAFDRCFQSLLARAGAPPRVALAALGGYGRRLQLPRSDVDVLLLHDRLSTDELEQLATALFYPLWDAGFTLGQAVRTADQCLHAAREHLTDLTALLDARWIAGDRSMLDRALVPVRALACDDPSAFARRLMDEASRRAGRFGSAAHDLEPDLKEGAGGLRDAASIAWLEKAVGESLVEKELLHPSERERVDVAEEFLVRARSAVQLSTGKRADRLVSDLQTSVARAMGHEARPDLSEPDALMRAVFEHARNVQHALDLTARRLLHVGARRPARIPRSAANVLETLAEHAERGSPVPAATVGDIATALGTDPVEWNGAVRSAFLRLLRTGERGVEGLEVLDRQDSLERFVPAWAGVRCRPQRDPYHRFTVDTHLTSAVGEMARLLDRPDDELADALERQMVKAIDDRDALLLGALLHDVGKVGHGKHVPIGAEVAAGTLRDMGFPPSTRELATFMVAEHLLLPDTATRRDLTEENLVIDVAARVGSSSRLAALWLLAEADARATGPAAWTPWRRALIRELVVKVLHVFERGDMGRELAERLAERVGRVRDLLDGEPESAVDRFVLQMPRGYFLSVEPERAARHFRTVAPALGRNEVRSVSSPGSGSGTYEVLAVAVDRPGLLSWIAGALAVCGISILSAQVFTTDDGAAVDLFEVQGVFEPEITESRWREFRSTLRGAVEGSISLEHRVDEKRRRYPASTSGTAVTVQIDNDASDFSTVVEVGAADRVGLLHDATRTLAELHLDVHLAKVATFDGRVIDAFYVRDSLGRKVTDAGQLGEIEHTLRERLDG